MIKLEVEDYCQNCPNFEVYTDTCTTVGYGDGIGRFSLTDHTISCKYREVCIEIHDYIKAHIMGSKKGETENDNK